MPSFLTSEEQALTNLFLEKGYVIAPAEDRAALNRVRDLIISIACERLGRALPEAPQTFLDDIGALMPVEMLNDFRVHLISRLNAEPWVRLAYFAVARKALETLVGNELAMQRRINLSIQLPADDSSLLPVHADVWSGDSPFELVLWIPLVDCHRTKSMFLLPPGPAERLQKRMASFAGGGSDDLFRSIEPDLLWLDVPYGSFLLFNQNLPHGNRVNQEPDARWSMNCRFKSVFTPYADKKLGEFFEPITLRAASRIGLDYEYPTGFEE